MILVEHLEDKKKRILDIDSLLDIQWWLYKSILTKQPIDTKYYRNWFLLYKEFYNLIDKFDSNEIDEYDLNLKLKQFISRIKESKSKLQDVIKSSDLENLDTVLNKLISGIMDIINILEE